jgi:hypothetical protein
MQVASPFISSSHPGLVRKTSLLCDALSPPVGEAVESGCLYGGMRPGMPPGRKHFRRSRDAPILGHSRQNPSREWGLLQKKTCDRPDCQRAMPSKSNAVKELLLP